MNRQAEKEHYDSLKADIKALRDVEFKSLREDFDTKFTRIYVMFGTATLSIIVGVVTAMVRG